MAPIIEDGQKVVFENSDAKRNGFASTTTLSSTSLPGPEKLIIEDDEGGTCGWLCLKPSCLQKTRIAKHFLFWLCFGGILQGIIVNGFVNVIITTLEKRFDLTSTESGIIVIAYDIASLICVLPVSYLGGRPDACKPKWIGWGIFIMGFGSLVFALPNFVSGLYQATNNDDVTGCLANATDFCTLDTKKETNLSKYQYFFIAGQLLHGIGASPLFTLGVTFLDEIVPTKMSSVYTGSFYMVAILGPAIGFGVASQMLKLYTDFLWVTAAEAGIAADSELWVGAWWLGFVVVGFLAIIVAFPLLAFPARLPGVKAIAAQKVSEAYERKKKPREDGEDDELEVEKGKTTATLKEIPAFLKQILLNPTFIGLSLAGACEAFVVAGFGAFVPKFMESEFAVSASWAALLVGILVVPAGSGGTFLGGYLVKHFKMSCKSVLFFCAACTVVALLFAISLLIWCPELPYAGVNMSHNGTLVPAGSTVNLTSKCNSNCNCVTEMFDPICGVDNVMYFSPCHAGCTITYGKGAKRMYADCSCIEGPLRNVTINGAQVSVQASHQKCNNGCDSLNLFIGLFFFLILFTMLNSMPALNATLRCVTAQTRSFALGVQWLIIRSVGSIPSPVIFGAIFDSQCLVWQESCGEQGSCVVYDNFSLSRNMLGIGLGAKTICTLCFTFAWLSYKAPNKVKPDVKLEKSTSVQQFAYDNPSVDPT